MPTQQSANLHKGERVFAAGSLLGGIARESLVAAIFWRYAMLLLLLPAIVYFSAIPLIRTQWFERWNPSHWGPILDYGFRTEGQNADVVVFGDSSAFLGLDPRIMKQQGITSVVLPNTAGSLPVVGDQALEYYLAHNRPPRLIVFYFTAWDLDYVSSNDKRLYEGEEILLRRGTRHQIIQFSSRHPLEVLAFPLRLYSTIGPRVLRSYLRGEDRTQEVMQGVGHVSDTEEFPPVAKPCAFKDSNIDSLRTDSVEALTAKYSARHYNVAIYLAPIPECTGADVLEHRSYSRLGAIPPSVLPPSSFKDDGYFAHVEPESVSVVTQLFTDWIAVNIPTRKGHRL